MIRIRKGTVTNILESRSGITEVIVTVEGREAKAINYDQMTGPIYIGNQVMLNTTAIHKGLGTGGNHFVMANLSITELDAPEEGHIMKLRYTPQQIKCFSVEEQDSPYHERIKNFVSLDKMPVIVATLHSMLAPAVVALKNIDKNIKIAYIMTDGAALPIALSKLVAQLRTKGLIDATITVGHAFGGDFEAVNIYSGLIAAKEIVQADVTIVAMGPGIVGTGTKYGFTGVEQGEIINAVNILGGQPVAVPRISFADKRERHRGISHQTLTILEKIVLTPCVVALPQLTGEKQSVVVQQLDNCDFTVKPRFVIEEASEHLDLMANKHNLKVTTMGRKVDEDREFFLTAAAAGVVASKLLPQ